MSVTEAITVSALRWQSEYVRQFTWQRAQEAEQKLKQSKNPWLANLNPHHNKIPVSQLSTDPRELDAQSAALNTELHKLEKQSRPLQFANIPTTASYGKDNPDFQYSKEPKESKRVGGGFNGRIFSASSRRNNNNNSNTINNPKQKQQDDVDLLNSESKTGNRQKWDEVDVTGVPHHPLTHKHQPHFDPYVASRDNPVIHSSVRIDPQDTKLTITSDLQKHLADLAPTLINARKNGASYSIREEELRSSDAHNSKRGNTSDHLLDQEYELDEERLNTGDENYETFVEVDHDDDGKNTNVFQEEHGNRRPQDRPGPLPPTNEKNKLVRQGGPPSGVSEVDGYHNQKLDTSYSSPNPIVPRPGAAGPNMRPKPKEKGMNYDFSAVERIEREKDQQKQYYQQQVLMHQQQHPFFKSYQNPAVNQTYEQVERDFTGDDQQAGSTFRASSFTQQRQSRPTQLPSKSDMPPAGKGNGMSTRLESATQFATKNFGAALNRQHHASHMVSVNERLNRPHSPAQSYTSSQIQAEMDERYGHQDNDEEEEPDSASHSYITQPQRQQFAVNHVYPNSGVQLGVHMPSQRKKGLMLMPSSKSRTGPAQAGKESYVSEYKREFQDWSWKRQAEMSQILLQAKERNNPLAILGVGVEESRRKGK